MAKTLQFKVTLLNVKPVIWRRFEIEENIMFFDLHQVIQLVMGWENSHLYQFIFDKNNFIGDPEMLEDGNFEVADDMETEVAAILDEPGSEIMYEYDFGDGWMHQVVLEKISEGKPKHDYPFCVNGENSCPPEDCGGPPGYLHLVKVLGNKNHKEYKSLLFWVGKNFDPKQFDAAKVNRKLKKLWEH